MKVPMSWPVLRVEEASPPVFGGPGGWLVWTTPQRQINSMAYILSWSHCNDFFFLTSEGCPEFLRRPGQPSHRHSRGHLWVLGSVCWIDPWVVQVTTQGSPCPCSHNLMLF